MSATTWLVAPGWSQDIPDQVNDPPGASGFNCGNPPATGSMGQSFTPTLPSLSRVDLRMRTGGGFTDATTTIRIHTGDLRGPVIGEATTHLTTRSDFYGEFVPYAFSPPLCLVAGQKYAIEWISLGGLVMSWMGKSSDVWSTHFPSRRTVPTATE